MNEDAALLRRYTAEKCEDAFRELVHRHLGFVYAAALRRLNGDSHGAADVAQSVFIRLARDAAPLSRHSALTGWLYTTTRNAAVDWVRVEQHRKAREQAVAAMQESVPPSEEEKDWQTILPLLDATMDELDEGDRAVILLRFFAGHRFTDIGVALRVSEDAARMRLERALEKLRRLLKRRGVISSAGTLGSILTTHADASTVVLPVGLMERATITALAGATAAVSSLPPCASIMVSMTTKKAAVGLAALLGAAGLATIVYRSNSTSSGTVAQPIKPAPTPVPSAVPPPLSPPSIAVQKQVANQASAASTTPARSAKANVKIDLLQALGTNNHFHDDAVGISIQLPEGWKVLDAIRWGEGHRQNTVFMIPNGVSSANSSMYYKPYTPEERASLASTGAEALLREQAQKKEASRVAAAPDYRNVPESLSYFDVNGSPALTYFATYTQNGEVMTEHFIRVFGPNGYVMLFTNGRFEEVKALMPQLKQAASTVKGP